MGRHKHRSNRGHLMVTVNGKITLRRLMQRYRVHTDSQPELMPEAYKMARDCHSGKTRKDQKTKYIVHPLRVAIRAAELGMNESSICAALLHDVMEDANVGRAEIEARLNRNIAHIVVLLTKPKWSSDDHGWVHSSHPRFTEIQNSYEKSMYEWRSDIYYRQLLESGNQNAMLIKVLDNLDNLQDMEPLTDEQRKRQLLTMAKQTMILAPRMFRKSEVRMISEEFRKWNVLLPEPVFARVPKEPIVLLPPRKMIWAGSVDMLPEPGRYISVYADPKWLFLTGSLELGLPYLGEDVHYSQKIQYWLDETGSGLGVTVGRSMVPPGSKAREKIYIIRGFRGENEEVQLVKADGDNAVVELPQGRITIPMKDIGNMRFSGEKLEQAFRDTVEKYRLFIKQLRNDFYENHLKPVLEQY